MSESKGGGMDPELRVDLAPYGDRVTPGRANQITLARVNTPTRNILKKFDNNGDGRIDANEIQTIVSTLVAEKFKSKAFRIGLIILCVFTAILLGAMFGLTWAVVAALKDTQVRGNILVTNDRAAVPIWVGNMDLTVSDGKLVSRNSSSVLTTSRIQTPGVISANTSFDKLLALQNLVFVSANNARYSVAVLGVARIPSATAKDGYIIRFHTAAGTLTLEDDNWSVTNLTGPLLESLFNTPAGHRRRLIEGDDTNAYGLCEDGNCGEYVACGVDDWNPCPAPREDEASSSTDPSNPKEDNTGLTGGGCSTPTSPIYYCSAGLTQCYGSAITVDQKRRYMNQTGCSSNCGKWTYNAKYQECEGTFAKQFCCV